MTVKKSSARGEEVVSPPPDPSSPIWDRLVLLLTSRIFLVYVILFSTSFLSGTINSIFIHREATRVLHRWIKITHGDIRDVSASLLHSVPWISSTSSYSAPASVLEHPEISSSLFGDSVPFDFPKLRYGQFEMSELVRDEVREQYENLVRVMLFPFQHIPRKLYMDVFHRKACTLCVLIQVKNGKVFLYDPKSIRSRGEIFHQIRILEALYWIKQVVQRKLVDNVELVLSVSDSIITTDKPHNYRFADPEKLPRPIFGATWCNVSSNLPFPIIFYDLMRRAFPNRLKYRRFSDLDELDDRILQYMSGEGTPWSQKTEKVIFRGNNRESQYISHQNNTNTSTWCYKVGRSLLHAIGQQHKDIMDTVVTGYCGGQKIGMAVQFSMFQQQMYKYQIYVEGNGFWADRLPLLLFSQSCPIKQSTPCKLFFEPLLTAWEHYVPTDFFFSDLVENLNTLKANDALAKDIATKSQLWAKEFLSHESIVTFTEIMLNYYASRLDSRDIHVLHKAIQVYPVYEYS